MKILLIVLLTLFNIIFFQANAQKNLNGYYVSLAGDTVKGTFIKYGYVEMNPSKVNFKPARQPAMVLDPETVKMYQVEGQPGYFSFMGIRHLDGKDLPEAEVLVFLKLVFENSDTRLYELKDPVKTNFYLQTSGDKMQELIYSQWIENDELFTNDSFKIQIATLFKKEISEKHLNTQLSELEYFDDRMVTFFKKLLGKSNVKNKKLYKPDFFLAGGASINRFQVGNEDQTDINTTVSPVFSAGIQLYNQKTSGRLFYAVSLSTYSFSNEPKWEQEYAGTTTYYIKGRFITPSLNVGYKLINKPIFQFYLQAGGGPVFNLNLSRTDVFKSYANPPIIRSESVKLEGNNLSVSTQAGFIIAGRLGIWGSYFIPMILESQNKETTFHKPIQIGIQYIHKRKY